jgi:hypothetical protein
MQNAQVYTKTTAKEQKFRQVSKVAKLFVSIYFVFGAQDSRKTREIGIDTSFSFLLFSSFIFMLFIYYFPLLSIPTAEISITQVKAQMCNSLKDFEVLGVFSRNILIVFCTTLLGLGLVGIFCVNAKRKLDFDYMISALAIIFSVLMLSLLMNYFILLFFVKLVQVYKFPATIISFKVLGLPLLNFALAIFLFVLPVRRVGSHIYKEEGLKGFVTYIGMLVLFVVFAWFLGKDIRYIQDVAKGLPVKKVVSKPVATNVAATAPPALTPLLLRSASNDTSITLSVNSVGVLKEYMLRTNIIVTNNSDQRWRFPANRSLVVNLAVDTIALLQQYGDFSGDFTFGIDKVNGAVFNDAFIAPHSIAVLHVKGVISAETYDYMRRYMRHHPDMPLKIVVKLEMSDLVNPEVVANIRTTGNWAFMVDRPAHYR